MAEFTSQSREERTIRSLSVLSFFCLPSILSNHQLVPPASSRPIIDPSFLQKHAIFSFKLTPSLEITSPLYSLFTSPFYHPSLRHFLSHGIIIWSNGYTLNRGFEGTLLTALGGNISYIIGCTIDWYFSETERIDVSASWTRAVEGTKELLWKGVSQVDVVNVGNQYKGAVEGTLLKLRSKLFGYSVYGLQGISYTFFASSVTTSIFDLYYLLRSFSQPSQYGQPNTSFSTKLMDLALSLFLKVSWIAPQVYAVLEGRSGPLYSGFDQIESWGGCVASCLFGVVTTVWWERRERRVRHGNLYR